MNNIAYADHAGLYRGELESWLPQEIFDAHVHLGLPDAVGPISVERQADPLTTFTSFTREEFLDCHRQIFPRQTLVGAIAFPFPLREVCFDAANRYLADVVAADPRFTGFILSNPHDTSETIAQYEEALNRGVRFRGVKPYYDLLGRGAVRSVYDIPISEFVPDDLLAFMDRERLIMMLHTSRIGMGDEECQRFVRRAADRYPGATIILAHMGRYLEDRQFLDFLASGVAELPTVYLEMSSATSPLVYRETLRRPELHKRLLFGTDVPFGLITGEEFNIPGHAPTFLTRDIYTWTDREVAERFSSERQRMTFNTWHTAHALKMAMDDLGLSAAEEENLKRMIFRENAEHMLRRTF